MGLCASTEASPPANQQFPPAAAASPVQSSSAAAATTWTYGDSDPIIVDFSQTVVQVGIAGDDEPREVFPATIALDRGVVMMGRQPQELERAKHGKLVPRIRSRVGEIQDEQKVIELYQWCSMMIFHHLKKKSSAQPVFWIDSPLSREPSRGLITHMLFRMFGVPAVYFMRSPVACLYGVGKFSGVSVQCSGDTVTVVPVVDGTPMLQALQLGGTHLRSAMRLMLLESVTAGLLPSDGLFISHSECDQVLDQMEDKHFYVAPDFDAECRDHSDSSVEFPMPQGQKVVLRSERFRAPEGYFQPALLKAFVPLEKLGRPLHVLVLDAINHPSITAADRAKLYSVEAAVCVSGRCAFKGMEHRLKVELLKLAPESVPPSLLVKGVDPCQFAPFIGASIVASLSSAQPMWVTKAEYDALGDEVVKLKCK